MDTNKHSHLIEMFKPLVFTSATITVSLLPYIEEGLRISTLIVGLCYTCYKFRKEYLTNKKNKK